MVPGIGGWDLGAVNAKEPPLARHQMFACMCPALNHRSYFGQSKNSHFHILGALRHFGDDGDTGKPGTGEALVFKAQEMPHRALLSLYLLECK